MSFEGYFQRICSRGHLFTDCALSTRYDGPEPCDCGEPGIWENLVDDTNCDDYGIIPEHAFTEHPDGPDSVDDRYLIPSDEEVAGMRCYAKWSGSGHTLTVTYIPLESI